MDPRQWSHAKILHGHIAAITDPPHWHEPTSMWGNVRSDLLSSAHLADGTGMAPSYPPLAGDPSIAMDVSGNPLRMVLNGGYAPQTFDEPRPYGMPPFAQVLSDEELAAVVTYIRVSYSISIKTYAGLSLLNCFKEKEASTETSTPSSRMTRSFAL